MRGPEAILKDRIKAYFMTVTPKPYVYMPVPGGFGRRQGCLIH